MGYPGHPSGIANSEDNRRSLLNLAPYVSNYRTLGWSPYTGLGGSLPTGTSATSLNWGRVDVFTIAGGASNHVFQRTLTTSATWGAWTDIGQPSGIGLSQTPGSVAWQSGTRLDVFAHGSDGAMWHRWWSSSTGWSVWNSFGGVIVGGTSAVSPASNQVNVFAIAGGTGDHLFQRYFDGSAWSSWIDLGRPAGAGLTRTPGAVTWAGGRIDVFARGTDTALWQRYYTPGVGWSAWVNLGGVLTSSPTAVSPRANRLDVFVTAGSSGQDLFHRWWESTWGPFTDLGTPPGIGVDQQPGSVAWNDRIDVFPRGTDGQMWWTYHPRV